MTPTRSPEEILQSDRELQLHLAALGLAAPADYCAWCTRHGFSPRLVKNWRERCKERAFAARDSIAATLVRARQEKHQPAAMLARAFRGELSEAERKRPDWRLVAHCLSVQHPNTREAFQELLQHVHRGTRLFTAQPACRALGSQIGNTFIEGLAALAEHRPHWLRPLGDWRPRSHSARRQFSSLAEHLLAKYAVPRFADTAWFRGSSAESTRQQLWYRALGLGQSPRSLDLPIPMSRQMAHHFLRAPQDFLMEHAIRWAQVLGLGGEARLAQAILGSRLGREFENYDFWTTVIRWLIVNPLFDRSQVGPLLDYIEHEKFQAGENQATEFSLKGRTPASILARMHLWHAGLRKSATQTGLCWPASGIGGLDWTEGVLATGTLRRWTIVELLSRQELFEEGRALRHCVASYDKSCALGGTTIWSLGVERSQGSRKRVLTIEVAAWKRAICQVRGKVNRLPKQKEIDIVRRWAEQEGLVCSYIPG